jgi:allantoinase
MDTFEKQDTLFREVRVVTPEGVSTSDVGVKDGKISFVATPGVPYDAARIIEGNGHYLLPGLIETHLHTRVPAFDYRETFLTGTTAAAAGGITTVLEMPVSQPPTYSVEVLENRISHARRDALVDFGFYGAAGEDNLQEIGALAENGVIGFKTFTQAPPPGREKEFTGLCARTSAALYQVFRQVSRTGLISAIHAEDDSLIALFRGESASKTLEDWSNCRPPIVEMEAISRSLVLARQTGVRLAVCHVSTAESIEIIESARCLGQEVYIESCPHYFLRSWEESAALGPLAKIKPPLRSKEASLRLRNMYAQGRIDYLGSDHAPFTGEEKWRSGKPASNPENVHAPGDLFSAPDGIAVMELTLPLLLFLAREGSFKMEDIVRTCCQKPAYVFGLFPRKGVVQPGSDADLVLVDMERVARVDISKLRTKAKECGRLYHKAEIVGGILLTMVRGMPVMEDGQIVGKPGWGQWLRPGKNS